MINRIMHGLQRIMTFWSRVNWFAKYFYECRSHEWKSLADHPTRVQKSLYTVTNVLHYFLRAISCSEYSNPLTTIIDRSFRLVDKDGRFWLSIVASPRLISDVKWTRGTGIVTSYFSTVLACANWRKGNIHWWITTVNTNLSTSGIHDKACKKINVCMHMTNPWSTLGLQLVVPEHRHALSQQHSDRCFSKFFWTSMKYFRLDESKGQFLVTHLRVPWYAISRSDKNLSSVQHQLIILSKAGLLPLLAP